MRTYSLRFLCYIVFILILGACGVHTTSTPIIKAPTPTAVPATLALIIATTAPTNVPLPLLSITLGETNNSKGITLRSRRGRGYEGGHGWQSADRSAFQRKQSGAARRQHDSR